MDRRRCVVNVEQLLDELLRLGMALAAPARAGSVVGLGQVAPQHRGQAVEVAAPVERPRRRQVAAPTLLERMEKARRLVVVVGFTEQRQRSRQVDFRDEREGNVDQRQRLDARRQRLAGHGPAGTRRRPGNADVVGLQVEVDEAERMEGVERDHALARQRPPVGAVVEDIAQRRLAAPQRHERRPLVERRAGIARLQARRAARVGREEVERLRDRRPLQAAEADEDLVLALGPGPEIDAVGGQEALGVAPLLARARHFAKDFDVAAGGDLQSASAEDAFYVRRGHRRFSWAI